MTWKTLGNGANKSDPDFVSHHFIQSKVLHTTATQFFILAFFVVKKVNLLAQTIVSRIVSVDCSSAPHRCFDECVRSGAHTHPNTLQRRIKSSGSIFFSIRRSVAGHSVFICDVHLVLFPCDGRKAFCSPSHLSSFRCLGSATLSVRINFASPYRQQRWGCVVSV